MFKTYDSTAQSFKEQYNVKRYVNGAWEQITSGKTYDATAQAWVERFIQPIRMYFVSSYTGTGSSIHEEYADMYGPDYIYRGHTFNEWRSVSLEFDWSVGGSGTTDELKNSPKPVFYFYNSVGDCIATFNVVNNTDFSGHASYSISNAWSFQLHFNGSGLTSGHHVAHHITNFYINGDKYLLC